MPMLLPLRPQKSRESRFLTCIYTFTPIFLIFLYYNSISFSYAVSHSPYKGLLCITHDPYFSRFSAKEPYCPLCNDYRKRTAQMEYNTYLIDAKYFWGALYSQQSILALVIGVFHFSKVFSTGSLWVLLCVLVAQSTRKTFSIVISTRLYEKTSSNFLHFHAKDTRKSFPIFPNFSQLGTWVFPKFPKMRWLFIVFSKNKNVY